MKRFPAATLFIFMLMPFAAHGDDYKLMRAKFQHNANRCDLIYARDVVQLQATPIADLKKQQKELLAFLEETKNLRQACYEEAKESLAEVMAVGLAENQQNPKNTALTLQLELDEQLPALLDLRQKISAELLDSMADDLTYTIKNERKLAQKNKKGTELFMVESDRTASLIKQDMGVVLSIEGRQLQLDELLTPPTEQNTEAFVKLKLRKAMHYLARTLMLYEDIQADNRHLLVLLAKLRSEYLYAAGQLNELIALDPELNTFTENARPNMRQIVNRVQLLELDIEGALRDYRSKTMEENINNWLSEVYQDLSQLSLAIKTQLQWFGVAGQVVGENEKLPELPPELEAFIKTAEQPEPEPTPETTHQKSNE